MNKNVFLHDFVYEKLNNGVGLTFKEIDDMAKCDLGDRYNQKQLRNLLYNLVKQEKLELDRDDNKYYMSKNKNSIMTEYLNELKNMCLKMDKKLEKPFVHFHGDELLEAEKLYKFNQEIHRIIVSYEKDGLF